MSRLNVEATFCDFCGYGGLWARPEDFHSVALGDAHLCRWCCTPAHGPGAQIESGAHLVTFGDDTWSCSCGEEYRWPWLTPGRVLNALPSVVTATATRHVQRSGL